MRRGYEFTNYNWKGDSIWFPMHFTKLFSLFRNTLACCAHCDCSSVASDRGTPSSCGHLDRDGTCTPSFLRLALGMYLGMQSAARPTILGMYTYSTHNTHNTCKKHLRSIGAAHTYGTCAHILKLNLVWTLLHSLKEYSKAMSSTGFGYDWLPKVTHFLCCSLSCSHIVWLA